LFHITSLFLKDLEFHGHDVVLPPFSETKDWTENEEIPIEMRQEESYDRRVVPTMYKGKLQGRTDKQIFSTTLPFILPVGMCGGPVTILRDDSKLASVLKTSVVSVQTEPVLTAAGGRKRPSSVSVELSKPANMRNEVLKVRREEIANAAAEEGERAGDAAEAAAVKDKPLCAELVVGLLEGIVPTDHPIEEIRGSPVFVESMDIIK
jgi:hypothetical protein